MSLLAAVGGQLWRDGGGSRWESTQLSGDGGGVCSQLLGLRHRCGGMREARVWGGGASGGEGGVLGQLHHGVAGGGARRGYQRHATTPMPQDSRQIGVVIRHTAIFTQPLPRTLTAGASRVKQVLSTNY